MALTKAEMFDILGKACKHYDQLYQYGAVNGTNFLGTEDAVISALEGGQFAFEVMNDLKNMRTTVSNLYTSGKPTIEKILRKLLEVAYSKTSQGKSIDEVITEIAEGMDGVPETIASRSQTFGSISSSVTNYDGNIYRHTTDRFGDNIESNVEGTVKLEVYKDRNNKDVESGNEKAWLYGSGTTPEDEISRGSAAPGRMELTFIRDEDSLLKNPSFTGIQETIDKQQQVGWYLSSTSNMVRSSDEAYRNDRALVETGYSLKFTGNGNVLQYFARENLSTGTNPDIPYILVCRYMRKSSATGNLTLRLGSQTTSATIGSATNDVWTDLYLIKYPSEFNEDHDDSTQRQGNRIQITVDTLAVGTVHIDSVILHPLSTFNGIHYIALAGGRQGDALFGDSWTWADTSSNTGRTQYTIHRLFGRSLPHAGSPTYADA